MTMNLERALRTLLVDWPTTPEFVLASDRGRTSPRVRIELALALIVAAAVVAVVVPQSRATLSQFLHIGSVQVATVAQLPPARERALAKDLGLPVDLSGARALVSRLLVPSVGQRLSFYHGYGGVLMLLEYHGQPVLLSESAGTAGPGLMEKYVDMGIAVEETRVGKHRALWVAGGHTFETVDLPPRLSGNALIWAVGHTTYRLEARTLERPDLIAVAEALVVR